jgi:hypothetical protein
MSQIPKSELLYLKTQIFDHLTDTLPSNYIDAVWRGFTTLFPNDPTPRPCGCSSGGKYWGEIIKRSKAELERLLNEVDLEIRNEDINLNKSSKSRKK